MTQVQANRRCKLKLKLKLNLELSSGGPAGVKSKVGYTLGLYRRALFHCTVRPTQFQARNTTGLDLESFTVYAAIPVSRSLG